MSMCGGISRIEIAAPAHHVQKIPTRITSANILNMDEDIKVAIVDCIYRASSEVSYLSRPYLSEANEIPLNVWLKAGVPPNGRTKKQHILIQQLNKKKRGR